jgi:hypothetical protein
MQSVCLKEVGTGGPLAEETTLVGLTFGGYLRSKVVPYFDFSHRFMYINNARTIVVRSHF